MVFFIFAKYLTIFLKAAAHHMYMPKKPWGEKKTKQNFIMEQK